MLINMQCSLTHTCVPEWCHWHTRLRWARRIQINEEHNYNRPPITVIFISILAHRNRDGIIGGKLDDEFAARFLLRLIERSDAAYHFDVALVRRHFIESVAPLTLQHQQVILTLNNTLISSIHFQSQICSFLRYAAHCCRRCCCCCCCWIRQAVEQFMNINQMT